QARVKLPVPRGGGQRIVELAGFNVVLPAEFTHLGDNPVAEGVLSLTCAVNPCRQLIAHRYGHRVTVRGFTYFQPNERWCLHQVSDTREAGAGHFAFWLGEPPPGRFQGRTGRLDLAVQAAD